MPDNQMTAHAIPNAASDPRAVWQIAAEEGTKTAAIRELMLEEGITQSQARKRVQDHRKATCTTGRPESEDV